jgi:O-succinylbenzoate synthase
MLKIFQDLEVLSIPTTTNFRGINHRELVIFRGSSGWSEFSPFLEYEDGEAKSWLRASLEAAYKQPPKLYKDRININATLPKVKPENVGSILQKFSGVKSIKIKVDSFKEDADLVEAALEYSPDAKIRLDVNGGWDLKSALLNLHDFHLRFGPVFEYIEQPCNSIEDLKALRKEIPMKIAVDESIRKFIDSDHSELSECADFAIIKWQPSGGVSNSITLVNEIGLPVVISSALESGIGLSQGLNLASALSVELGCGLGTANLLTSDIVNEELEITNGQIRVEARTPNMEKVAKFRASDERRTWWINRIERIIKSGGFDEYLN